MKVSEKVKSSYKSNSVTKHIVLHFPDIGIDVGMDRIHLDTMSLVESLFDSESIEFVGCIASKFKITVNNLSEDIKNQRIIVEITTDETKDEPITLFNGIVDSALKQSNRRIKEITAYDELYTKGNVDVSSWYKSLIFPITLKNLRDSLFNFIGIEQVDITLPNDFLSIQKQYNPNTLQALSVIKAVCQINGAFGIINRDGKFDYRILGDIKQVSYPSITLFPSKDLFPANPFIAESVAARIADEINAEYFSFYRNIEYEEYEVKVIEKVTVRQSEDDIGITYGTGINNYIVQGNIFTYGLTNQELTEIAKNIYKSIGGFSYYPFRSDNNGLPFIECGLDAVSYYVIDWEKTLNGKSNRYRGNDIIYEQRPFYVLNRELTGTQALKDSYSAKGEEYQSEFVTDLQTQIDTIKRNTPSDYKDYVSDYVGDYTYSKEYIDNILQKIVGIKVETVSSLPANPDDDTFYVIQGKVVVE